MANETATLTIAWRRRPSSRQYGWVVLAVQGVLGLLGQAEYATVHPDDTVTDAELNDLRDRWDKHDPWAR